MLTAEQWINRYPVAGLPNITVVCAAGEVNGAFFGTLGQMEAIEAFEDKMNTPSVSDEPTAEERIAAALEYQVMASLPDEEESTEEV